MITICSEDDILNVDVDVEVDSAIFKVKQGSHSELLLRAQALEHEKGKQIAAADRHRQLQIANINQLYEYEVEDANALYNVSTHSLLAMRLLSSMPT